MTKAEVRSKYKIPRPTLDSRLRREATKAASPRPSLHILPTPIDERATQAKYDRADARVKANQASSLKAVESAGVDMETLRKTIRLATRNMWVSTENRNADEALKWSRMLTNTAEKLGHVLASDDALKPPEPQLDLSTPEGRTVLTTLLSQHAELLVDIDPEALEVALREARRRQG